MGVVAAGNRADYSYSIWAAGQLPDTGRAVWRVSEPPGVRYPGIPVI